MLVGCWGLKRASIAKCRSGYKRIHLSIHQGHTNTQLYTAFPATKAPPINHAEAIEQMDTAISAASGLTGSMVNHLSNELMEAYIASSQLGLNSERIKDDLMFMQGLLYDKVNAKVPHMIIASGQNSTTKRAKIMS